MCSGPLAPGQSCYAYWEEQWVCCMDGHRLPFHVTTKYQLVRIINTNDEALEGNCSTDLKRRVLKLYLTTETICQKMK